MRLGEIGGDWMRSHLKTFFFLLQDERRKRRIFYRYQKKLQRIKDIFSSYLGIFKPNYVIIMSF